MFKTITMLFFLTFTSLISAETLQGKAVKVADGDTFTLLVDGSAQYRVRLVEIDAPESNQPYGQQSKQILLGLIAQKTVQVNVSGTDRYGRILGRVYVGEIDVNREMVSRGAAWVYVRYMKDQSLLVDEAAAKKSNKGIWALPAESRVAPWVWRGKN